MKRVEMIGKRFGRLVVTRLSENTSGKRKRLVYYCNCDCGKKDVEVVGEKLRSGHTKSCGCLKTEVASLTHKKENFYDLSGEYGVGVTFNTNKEFYFDLEDYEKIKQYCWLELENGYIVTRDPETKEFLYLHRLVMDASKGEVVDHKEHRLFDNRKEFLRKGTQSQNMMNGSIKASNTSGVTGVYYNSKNNTWIAEIMCNGKKIHIGSFKKKEDAAKAREDAEEQYFGEWSFKNSNKNCNYEKE